MGTCADDRACNCNGNVTDNDSGFLTEPTKLPITAFVSPVMTNSDPSQLLVHPMICYDNSTCGDPINNVAYESLGYLFQMVAGMCCSHNAEPMYYVIFRSRPFF